MIRYDEFGGSRKYPYLYHLENLRAGWGGGGGVVFGLEFLRHGGVEAWNSKGKGWGGRGDQLTTLDHQMFYFNYYTTLLLPKANLHQ